MQCFVYKGASKPDHFLFLPSELEEQGESLPDAILTLLGELSLVTSFELDENRKLAQADPQQVLSDMQSQGFYLQMPRSDRFDEEERYFN